MHSNQKLTGVLKGRTLTDAKQDGAALTLTMDDGAHMTVNTGGAGALPVLPASPIAKVRQQDTSLSLDTEDGKSVLLTLAEATSSVMVRDKNGVMEYAD